jgi:hypothetical protein
MSIRGKLMTATLLLVLCGPAVAAIVPQTVEQMVAGSEAIIRGKVVAQDSYWVDSPGRIIVTDVTIQVDEVWLGSLRAGRTMTVQVPGGEVGGIGMMAEHAPRFRPDEEAVLFLWTMPGADRLSIFNDEQGKYMVADDQVIGFHGRAIPLAELRSEVDLAIERSGR